MNEYTDLQNLESTNSLFLERNPKTGTRTFSKSRCHISLFFSIVFHLLQRHFSLYIYFLLEDYLSSNCTGLQVV